MQNAACSWLGPTPTVRVSSRCQHCWITTLERGCKNVLQKSIHYLFICYVKAIQIFWCCKGYAGFFFFWTIPKKNSYQSYARNFLYTQSHLPFAVNLFLYITEPKLREMCGKGLPRAQAWDAQTLPVSSVSCPACRILGDDLWAFGGSYLPRVSLQACSLRPQQTVYANMQLLANPCFCMSEDVGHCASIWGGCEAVVWGAEVSHTGVCCDASCVTYPQL